MLTLLFASIYLHHTGGISDPACLIFHQEIM